MFHKILKQIECPVSIVLLDKTANVKLIFCKLGCFSKTDLVLSIQIYFGKGTKCMVIEAFDKSLYVTIEDSIFALEEII